MARNNYNPNNYTYSAKKKEDKYEGLFTGKQRADLDGATDGMPVERISKTKLASDLAAQKLRGIGATMHSPHDFGW